MMWDSGRGNGVMSKWKLFHGKLAVEGEMREVGMRESALVLTG